MNPSNGVHVQTFYEDVTSSTDVKREGREDRRQEKVVHVRHVPSREGSGEVVAESREDMMDQVLTQRVPTPYEKDGFEGVDSYIRYR